VIEDVFSRLGHARVLARADAPNRASLAVMERLGMAFEGERVEGAQRLVSYTLARDAWLRRSR
jgi:RimJ/RimL family protein N-acetyltransferase